MLTQEEVVYAYRLLLGRDPENQSVISHYATEVSDLASLRSLFINSAEFRDAWANVLTARAPRLPFNGPAMDIELNAAPDKLAALFDKVSAQWHHLGETEPHWSVLTNENYYRDNFQMNREAFYASGESELKMFQATLARAKVDKSHLHSCLELGCGVGRVTAPLAKYFDHLIAVDISEAHLHVAKDHLASVHLLANVDLVHLGGINDIAQLPNFDVFYSRIVLQHNPPPVIGLLLEQILNKLNPGGIAFFQIPTYKAGYTFRIDAYLAHPNVKEMEMHYFPQADLLDLIHRSNCKVLELREDDAIGISATAISNSFLVQKLI